MSVRVVVIGASGNVGTSVLAALADEPRVESVLGLARRAPRARFAKTEWAVADVSRDPLRDHLRGADAVVHLAWLIQPSRDPVLQRATNVEGSDRVFRAAGEEGVGTVVFASSVGVYSPGPKDSRVDESWPTDGIPSSTYSMHKVAAERLLDRFEREHPRTRVVRLRPGLTFKREAGSEIRRLFAGPLLPSPLVRPGLVPAVPDTPRLRFQGVHSLDVGDAYRLALTRDVRGAFNIVAEPVLDAATLGRLLGARPLPVPASALRRAAALSFRMRLQPTPPAWIDLALGIPLLDATRAHDELGWTPARDAGEAVLEVLGGIRDSAGIDTPPLSPEAGGRARVRELLTGVGRRSY